MIGKVARIYGKAVMVAAMVLLAAARAAVAASPAVICPPSAPAAAVEPKPIGLAELLRQPREPSSRLERAVVVTDGWLIRVRLVTVRSAACPGDAGRYAILWLGTRKPVTGPRPSSSRNNAVVATVTLPVLRDQLGGEANLDRLVGSRLRVSGQLAFNASHRGELNRTRGTLWELRWASKIVACPAAGCPSPPPPPPPPPPVAAAPAPPPAPAVEALPPPPPAASEPDDDDDDHPAGRDRDDK